MMNQSELMVKIMAIVDPIIDQRDQAMLDLAAVRAEVIEADKRIAKLNADIASIHKLTGRGNHGADGNVGCAIDAILSMKESIAENEGLERRAEKAEHGNERLTSELSTVAKDATLAAIRQYGMQMPALLSALSKDELVWNPTAKAWEERK